MKRPLIIVSILIVAALALSFLARNNNEGETDHVSIFFSNPTLSSSESCEQVFPVQRVVPDNRKDDLKKYALEELLKGPTEEEEALGYSTSINKGVFVSSVEVKETTAFADFSKELDQGVAGSCLVLAIRSQITETLAQFSDVSGVVISVEGRVEDILQP